MYKLQVAPRVKVKVHRIWMIDVNINEQVADRRRKFVHIVYENIVLCCFRADFFFWNHNEKACILIRCGKRVNADKKYSCRLVASSCR